MKAVFLGVRGLWRDAADAARITINKEAGEKKHHHNGKEGCIPIRCNYNEPSLRGSHYGTINIYKIYFESERLIKERCGEFYGRFRK